MMMQGHTQAFPARGVSPQFNQLFFNLNQPTNTENAAAIRFHKPGPIIVEKLTDNKIDKKETPRKNDQPEPLKMSAVSEEKLSIAIQLAKRDLMQKRFSQAHLIENQEVTAQKSVQEKKRGTTKTKVTSHRTDGKGESKNNYKQNPTVLMKPTGSRSYGTKAKGFILESNQNSKRAIKERPEREGRSRNVTTASPSSGSVHKDQDGKQAQEIKRLRKELSHYIQKIEMLSRKGPSPVKDIILTNHQELDEAEERRKQTREVEQAGRSARLLYALQQQVREIKDDLDRIGPTQIRHTRKSRALNRLAAAHRGAVRAIQAFIQQLPSQGETSTSKQPPMYQELGLLIRQLSLCCSQMEIGGNGVPDDILAILQEAVEFQSNADETKPKLTSNLTSRKQAGQESQTAKKIMTRKKNASRSAFIEKDLPVRDTEVFITTTNKDEIPRIMDTNRYGCEDRLQEDEEFISERDYALRARLEALIRAKDVQKQAVSSGRSGHVRNNSRPSSYNPSPGKYHKTTKKTSVLLPPKSKRLKKKNFELKKQEVDDVHFTNATIASKLKTREVVKPPDNPFPPWSPGGIPRRIDSDLNNEGSVASDAKSPLNSPRSSPSASPRRNPRLSPRRSPRPSPRQTARRKVHFEEEADSDLNKLMSDFVEKEVARQAWLDTETEKKISEMQSSRSKEIDRLTNEVIEQAEEAVRKKVQPLLEEHQHRQQQTIEEKLHVGSYEEDDLLLDEAENLHVGGHEEDDLLLDEAENLQRIGDEIIMEERALDMQEEPALEKLLQRLEEMETEEDIIRRRLQKISYSSYNEDAVKQKQQKHEDGDSLTLKGTPLEGAQLENMPDVPVEHTSLQFTKNKKETKAYKLQVHYRLPKNSPPDAGEIMSDTERNSFRTGEMAMLGDYYQDSNFESQKKDSEHGSLKPNTSRQYHHKTNTVAARTEGYAPLSKPCTSLTVEKESLRKIEECRGRFEQHLKKTSHHTYGAFNPWKLVEEVSDEIVNELLEGVSEEIGSMTEVFVENVYKREFGDSSSKPKS